MNKQKGFTLIEFMIFIVFVLVFAVLVSGILLGNSQGNQVSWGVNGAVEIRCIEGYKVLISNGGRYQGTMITQLKDEQGRVITCTK